MVFYLNGMTEGASYQTAMVTRGDDVTIRIFRGPPSAENGDGIDSTSLGEGVEPHPGHRVWGSGEVLGRWDG